jgi:hypothetical protein
MASADVSTSQRHPTNSYFPKGQRANPAKLSTQHCAFRAVSGVRFEHILAMFGAETFNDFFTNLDKTVLWGRKKI